MKTVRLKVSGMTCGHCQEAVTRALQASSGVRSATVHLQDGSAEVDYDEASVVPEELISAVEEEGYRAALADGS